MDKFAKYENMFKSHLMDDVMAFWEKSDLIDKINGGYYTACDRYGKVYNTDKSVWFQGRCMWTYSALINRYGYNPAWEANAKTGKEFLDKYCTDSDGRMFFTVTADGRPLRKRRYFFSESFYCIAMAEYGFAMKDTDALEKAQKCFDMMLMIYKDPKSDPYIITPKNYTETRSEKAAANSMVMLCTSQVLRRCLPQKSAYYSKIVKSICDDMMCLFYKEDMKCMLETVSSDGSFMNTPSGRTVNPGHACENSWFLMNEALYSNDEKLMEKALNILDWSLAIGWDNECGGIYYFRDIKEKPEDQLEWDMKLWWVHNEAMIACLAAYGITMNNAYLEYFEKITEYSMEKFHDKQYGEWYGYLHRDGTVSHTQKGTLWKGPFHLPRALMICEALCKNIQSSKPILPFL
ncbi:MAG: AGE family epimerase/isomerase [Clostridia bacterium]|jgi:N-acylglucosamine 2-epimerase|nr:AGE family epimerase/isomerase [Clostridia bacterium]